MSATFMDHVKQLHALFEANFMDAYRNSNPRKRRNLLPSLQSVFRRWFYSSIVEEAYLSPANLLEAFCIHHNRPSQIAPVVHPSGATRLTGISTEIYEYSLDKHHIVNDIRMLIDYCTPHIDLDETNGFLIESAIELGGKISLNDPGYATYLLLIALRLRLLTKVPSVGINRFKPAAKAKTVLDQTSDRDLFRDIVEAGIAIAAKEMQNLVMLPESLFTPAYIRSLLTQPMQTDDIFARVYDVLGYDMEDLLDITRDIGDDGSMDDIDVDLLAGTFMTGVLLDKYFFTPFGHYMKLIRPLYILPFEIESEVTEFVDTSNDPDEVVIAFYAPCSSYTLTDLGLEYFDVQKTEDNYLDIAEAVPLEQMLETVFASQEALLAFAAVARYFTPFGLGITAPPPDEIYTFRVRQEDDPSIWLHIQMPDSDNLDTMYIEIADGLGLKNNGNYRLYHDKTENLFAEYSSPSRTKRGSKQAIETFLHELDLEHQKHMLLVAYGQSQPFETNENNKPIVRLQLELLHKKPPEFEPGEYPRISRVSKALRENI